MEKEETSYCKTRYLSIEYYIETACDLCIMSNKTGWNINFHKNNNENLTVLERISCIGSYSDTRK